MLHMSILVYSLSCTLPLAFGLSLTHSYNKILFLIHTMELYVVSFYNDPEPSWRGINGPFPRDPTSSQTKLLI